MLKQACSNAIQREITWNQRIKTVSVER